jgi:type I restriction enzyme S subunit
MALENNITSLQVSHCEERSKLKQSVSLIPKLRFKEFEGDWEKKKLGDVAKVKMCKRIFSSETTEIGDIPFYKIGTFGKEPDAFITKELYLNYKEKYSFPKIGDILISASGTLGRTVVYDGVDAYFQDSNIVWLDNNEKLITNSFLFYIYQIVKYDSEGGTIQRLYNSIISRAKFSKPNLPEQQKIASFLTSVDTKIQQLTTKKQLLENYKKGAMQQLFSQQLRFKPDVIARTKDEAISQNEIEFPDWEEKKLKDIVEKERKIRYGIVQPGKYEPEGRFMIRGQDYSSVKGWANSSEFFRVSENIEKKYKKARVKSGDLLITIVGAGTGWLEVVPDFLEGANITQTTGRVAINKNISSPGYVKNYFFSYNGRKEINKYIKGQAQPGLNIGDVEILKLPFPSLKEQQKIANYLSAIDTKIENVQTQIAKTQTFKKGLLQQMFV